MFKIHPDILRDATNLVCTFEGFRATPYYCPAGYRTIGYGQRMLPTDKRKQISKDEAKLWVEKNIISIYEFLFTDFGENLNKNQYVALISLVYNIGRNAFNRSTLRKFLKQNKISIYVLENEWKKWCHVQKKVVKGLQLRREKEFEIFKKK